MPMERLDIGQGPEEPRLARLWNTLTPAVRRGLVLLVAVSAGIAGAVLLSRVELHPARPTSPAAAPRSGNAFGPPPWATQPRQVEEPAFALVNRTSRKVFVSTPPRFVFTIPAHRRLLFARAPVCTYQRFTARFRHGPAIGTVHDFCSASRWVVLPSGETELR